MEKNLSTLEDIVKLKNICRALVNNPKDFTFVEEIESLTQNISENFVNLIQPLILSALYPVLKNIAEDKTR